MTGARNKPDWVERYRAEQHEASKQACLRQYRRMVEEGRLSDTKEVWRGFVHGWVGVDTYRVAARENENAGGESYLLMTVAWLFGGVLTFCPLLLLFMQYDGSDLGVLIKLSAAGAALLVLGEWMRRRWLRQAREASSKFRDTWAKLPVEET